jgi:hypothetical protein
MIPFELILALLDTMRSETVDGLASPGDPTAFGFGKLHGQLVVIEEMRERLTAAVEQRDVADSDL